MSAVSTMPSRGSAARARAAGSARAKMSRSCTDVQRCQLLPSCLPAGSALPLPAAGPAASEASLACTLHTTLQRLLLVLLLVLRQP